MHVSNEKPVDAETVRADTTDKNRKPPKEEISKLRRISEDLGNFIKPMLVMFFIGAQSEPPAFEKSEKSW
jgi:hypothetical protein